MNKKTIEDIDVKDKKVLVRCDFNVPLDENKNITSDNRIVAALPTIKYLMEHGAKVILCSHLGRPKGKINPEFSLKPVAKRLTELLGKEVKLASDIIGESAKELTSQMQEGDVVLLENVRFDEREEKNDTEFSKALAELTDGIYVNDAFGTAHRAHSSTEGVSHFVNTSVAGYLMEKEVSELSSAISNPERPFVSILGGLKVSDKIGVIENLLDKAVSIFFGHTNNVLYVVTDAAIYSFTYGMGNEVSVSTTSQFTPSNGEKITKAKLYQQGQYTNQINVMTGNPPTIAPNAWNNKALIIVTQSAEFNGKVSIVPMKQAGAGTLDISKALIYDGFGKILDVTTTGY